MIESLQALNHSGGGGALQYGDGEWGTSRWGWEGGTTCRH